jgi:hypothetical protein
MTTKLTSIVTIAFLLSLSSCALLPGQSEFTFPLVPRQDSCAGYYEGECDCSNPYVTVCDVASGEWLPSLPSEPSPPPPETSSPPQDVPSNPGCSKKNAKDVSKEFVLENFEIIDRKALLYRIREGKHHTYYNIVVGCVVNDIKPQGYATTAVVLYLGTLIPRRR